MADLVLDSEVLSMFDSVVDLVVATGHVTSVVAPLTLS